MILETERLILRPWTEADAPALYASASDPRIGPAAGWPPHQCVENSLAIIRGVLSAEETYAIVVRGETAPMGCIGLILREKAGYDLGERGGEIGFWLGVPYWGKGYMTEAVARIQRRAFEELGLDTLWCAYYAGNDRSRRVQEKCGFTYRATVEGVLCPLLGEMRTEIRSAITRAQWQNRG